MALHKEITFDNGITMNYHRIVRFCCDINIMNSIIVQSYLSEEEREKEKQAFNDKKKYNGYIQVSSYGLEVDENMSATTAYEYLKTLDKFKDAKDV